MLKKILSIISCFFLVFALSFSSSADNLIENETTNKENVAEVGVSQQEEQSEVELPEGTHNCNHVGHSGWKVLTSEMITKYYTGSLPSGNYYLADNLSLNIIYYYQFSIKDAPATPKNITLCLNGNVLHSGSYRSSSYSYYYGRGIDINFQNPNSTFTLTNCDNEKEHAYYVEPTTGAKVVDNGTKAWETASQAESITEKGTVKGGIIANIGLNDSFGRQDSYNTRYVLSVAGKGKVIFEAGTIFGNYINNSSSLAGAIDLSGLQETGVFEMRGGAIYDNTSKFGSIIYARRTTTGVTNVKISGGYIGNNKTEGTTAGIYLDGINFEMSGGTITDNVSSGLTTPKADNLYVDRTTLDSANVQIICNYEINGGNFGDSDKSFYVGTQASLTINNGYFEVANVKNKEVLNGIAIAETAMITDLGDSVGRYRYAVNTAWNITPTIEDWEYGDAPSEVFANPAPNFKAEYRYKLKSAPDTSYKPYNTTDSYPTEVGDYVLEVKSTNELEPQISDTQYIIFRITKRKIYINNIVVHDRLYDENDYTVRIEGGDIADGCILPADEGKIGILFPYKDEDGNYGKLEHDYNNVGKHKVNVDIQLTGAANGNYEIVQPELEVNIKPHKLTIKEIKWYSSQAYRPIIGKDIKSVSSFTAIVLDEYGNEIKGKIEFQQKFGVIGAYNTQKFIFTPDTSYDFTEQLNNNRKGNNYAGEYEGGKHLLEHSFYGEDIYINFFFADLKETMQYVGVYAQTYGAELTVEIFKDIFEEFKINHPEFEAQLANMTPYLNNRTLEQYVSDNKNIVLTSNQTINVTLKKTTYTVKFNYHNNGWWDKTENYYYGQRIKKPANPNIKDKIFIGWYVWGDGTGEDESQKKAWDFSVDFVTSNVELHAEYIDTTYTLKSIRVEQLENYILANSVVAAKDIAVFATYESSDGKERVVRVDWDDLIIEYVGNPDGDNRIHVKYPIIRVSIKDSELEPVEFTMNVRAIQVDTSQIHLKTQTYLYDGQVHEYNTSDIIKPIGVNDFEVLYSMNGVDVPANQVSRPGDYKITLKLLVADDYIANDLYGLLTILEPENVTKVTVVWNEDPLYYTGKHQVPTFRLYTVNEQGISTGEDVTSKVKYKLTYTQDGKPIASCKDAGDYEVTLSLSSTEYMLADNANNVFKFTISPAELDIVIEWTRTSLGYTGSVQKPVPNFFVTLNDVKTQVYPEYELTVVSGDGINIGNHTVKVDVRDKNYAYNHGNTPYISCEYEITDKVSAMINWSNTRLEYTGEALFPTPTFIYNGEVVTDVEYNFGDVTPQNIEVGNYTVTIKTADPRFAELDSKELSCSYEITPYEIFVEWIGEDYFIYDGKTSFCPEFKFWHDSEDVTEAMKGIYTVTGLTMNVGNPTLTVKIIKGSKNYELINPSIKITIDPKLVTTPHGNLPKYVYTGDTYNVLDDLLGDYDINDYNVSGTIEAKDAGTYSLALSPKPNRVWLYGANGNDVFTIEWTIEKAKISPVWNGFKFISQGEEVTPRIEDLDGIKVGDQNSVNYETDFIYGGTTSANLPGAYIVTVELNKEAAWTRNYELTVTEYKYIVAPDANTIVIDIVWASDKIPFNNEVQYPKYKVYNVETDELLDLELTLTADGESKWVGEYTVTATVPNGYIIASGASHTYEITLAADGSGNKPVDGGDNGDDGFEFPKLPEDFPLWQISLGLVSILLMLIFIRKGNENRRSARKIRKGLREEDDNSDDSTNSNTDSSKDENKDVTDESNVEESNQTEENVDSKGKDDKGMKTNVSLLGLVPFLFLGLEEKTWSLIAFILLGLAGIAFIYMIIYMIKSRKLEDKYDEQLAEERKMAYQTLSNSSSSEGELQVLVDKVTKTIESNTHTTVVQKDKDDTISKLLEQQGLLIQKLLEKDVIAFDTSSPEQEDEEVSEVDNTDLDQDAEETAEEWDNDDNDENDPEDEEENGLNINIPLIIPVGGNSEGSEVALEDPEKAPKKLPSNFRGRLKLSSEKNRDFYVRFKNQLAAKKGVTFRVAGRVEKIKYKGELIGAFGVASKHLKLWLALDPNNYDVEVYRHKDVSDKNTYKDVPMQVKVGSERAAKRADILLEELSNKFNLETKRRYVEKNVQELAFTLKHNALVRLKKPELLCEVINSHDVDVLSDEDLALSIEHREVEKIEDKKIATVSLDQICEKFQDGKRVTLEALQKKGVVGPEYNAYKVIASERLIKPLIIVANEFSKTAAKMIVLCGGRVIMLDEVENTESK